MVELCLFWSFVKIHSIFQLHIMFLTLTQMEVSLSFIYFLWCVIFHCLSLLQFISLFCHPWTFALFPVSCYYKRGCCEHSEMNLQMHLHGRCWNCWVMECVLVPLDKTAPNCFPKWLCLCSLPAAAVHESLLCFYIKINICQPSSLLANRLL